MTSTKTWSAIESRNAQPVAALVSAYYVANEPIRLASLAGLVLIVGGVYVAEKH